MEKGETVCTSYRVELRISDEGWWWMTCVTRLDDAEKIVRKEVDEAGGSVTAGRVVRVTHQIDRYGSVCGPAERKVVYNYRKGGRR